MAEDCVFCKIAAGEIPAEKVFEDEKVVAFRDINPTAPTHVLIIPREHIPTFNDLGPEHAEILSHIFAAAKAVAEKEGLTSGYRLVGNCLEGAGQQVFHIHLHLIGGRPLGWPPG